MSVLFVVLPLAVLVSAVAVVAYIWAVRNGQLDDLTTPALRVLEDETSSPIAESSPKGGGRARSPGSPSE